MQNKMAPSMNMPWVESPFFYESLVKKELTGEQEHKCRFFHEHGYVILDNVVEPGLAESIINEVSLLYEKRWEDRNTDLSQVNDAWKKSDAPKKLAASPKITEVLELLYGRTPHPIATVNSCYSVEQPLSRDSENFGSFPARFTAGVWVALENVTLENGPLYFYPRSQKLPHFQKHEIENGEDFLAAQLDLHRFRPTPLTLTKGSAILWSGNLIHGQKAPTSFERTRHAQLIHYGFDECFYYQPMKSNLITGEYSPLPLVDICTGEKVRTSYNKTVVYLSPLRNGVARISLGSELPALTTQSIPWFERLLISIKAFFLNLRGSAARDQSHS